MASGHQSRTALIRGVQIPASQTLTQATAFGISHENRLNCKLDLFLGQVSGTPTIYWQDSNGHGVWNTIKSSALSASTDITVTADYTTGTFTAASHGLTNGQLVGLSSSGFVPGNLDPQTRYFVTNATLNTFQLSVSQTGSMLPASFSDNGSGTITVTAATVLTLSVNVQVSGDQTVLPLRPTSRIAVTTNGGQAVQLLDVRFGNSY
jgi:hypothetical protein